MPASVSWVKNMLHSLQNLLGFSICINKKPSEEIKSNEKLLTIFNELTVGISEVFDDEQAFDEYLRCDNVACKIRVLSEQIGQVRTLYTLWSNGYNLDPQELTVKLRSLNLLVDYIRDDVFCAYLRLPPTQKLLLLKKKKHVSAVFAVLGALENEVLDMMKSMSPNDGLMKTVKPLLKPNFNQLLYKRQAKNFNNYDPPAYQSAQYSYQKASQKTKLVDAWTEPLDHRNYSDDLVGNAIALHIHHTRNTSCQASLTDDEQFDDFVVTEDTVTLKNPTSRDNVSFDRLDIDSKSRHSLFLQDVHCQQRLNDNSFGSQQELSIWKIAAALIAELPES